MQKRAIPPSLRSRPPCSLDGGEVLRSCRAALRVSSDVVHESCHATSPHQETILWGAGGGCPQGVLFLRTQRVLGEGEVVHGRFQACSTCSEAFPGGAREAIYGKYHRWHSAAQPLKPCLPWGDTCTLGVCLGERTEAAEKPLPPPVFLRRPLLAELHSWQKMSVFKSNPIITEQTKRRAGLEPRGNEEVHELYFWQV